MRSSEHRTSTYTELQTSMADSAPPSKLGTKEYWDQAYAREIENFHDSGDTGKVWFGLQCQRRVASWLQHCPLVDTDKARVLDVGCGNGALLLELCERGFVHLTGVDYSHGAVELARNVAEKQSVIAEFIVADILNTALSPLKGRCFDVCVDKGTFDAISLSEKEPSAKQEVYVKAVACLLEENGLLIVASCNWTEEELKATFAKEFTSVAEIPAPKFQFGGQTGQTVSTVVFRKS